jgi:hypothetical protein
LIFGHYMKKTFCIEWMDHQPQVEQTMLELLVQLTSVNGLLIGITENIPPERWQHSCRASMDGLERHTKANPGMYTI